MPESQESPASVSPPNLQVEDNLVKSLYDRADHLETKLNVASENGLFEHQDKVKHKEILDRINKALSLSLRKKVSPADYSQAIEDLDTAQNLYDRAIHAVGLRKRLSYIYGIPILIYLMLILVMILIFAWNLQNLLLDFGDQLILSIPIQILLSGAVGSILRGVKALWSQVDQMQYRKVWMTWFLLCPIMGALLGGVVYLAFFVGIAVSTLTVNFANPSLAILIAVIAGYNWEWAQEVLNRVIEVLQGRGKS